MSIDCMSAVLDRYPGGGGERLVALALADNAARDGTRIFPGVNDLAHRARLSHRSVQRHLTHMVSTGWLVVVHVTTGRRGDTNEYRISPQWLDGQACIAPTAPIVRQPKRKPKQIPLVTPDDGIATGDKLTPVQVDAPTEFSVHNSTDPKSAQVTKQVVTGDTSVTQTIINHQNTNTPLTPLPARNCGQGRRGDPKKQQKHRTAGLSGKEGAKASALNLPTGTRWIKSRTKIEAVGDRIGIGRWDQAAYDRACIRSPGAAASCSFAAYTEAVRLRVEALRGARQELHHAG